jgi:PhnB protein
LIVSTTAPLAPEIRQGVTPPSFGTRARRHDVRLREILIAPAVSIPLVLGTVFVVARRGRTWRAASSVNPNQGGSMTKPIPEDYHTLTPYFTVDNAAEAIEFYKRAFGAKERMSMPGPDGKIAHAELEIGDSVLMLSDPFPQSTQKTPKELGGTTAGVFVYVEDVDAVFEQAVNAGATVTMALEDMFWGDRFGSLQDPFGHSWSVATHKEDLTPEQIAERGREAMAAMV